MQRNVLQDFRSCNSTMHEIGSHDQGSPPFSLQWGETKRQGLLVSKKRDAHTHTHAHARTHTRMRLIRTASLSFGAHFCVDGNLNGFNRLRMICLFIWSAVLMRALLWQAVADEEGNTTLINTRMSKNHSEHRYNWSCHRNAIFDLAFAGMSLPFKNV